MPKLSSNFEKLKTSIEWSERQLDAPRRNRVDALRQYVGNHYNDGGSDKVVPTNFMELAITIYTRMLAARAPRVLITAHNEKLKPYARNMELAINQVPDEIDLASTLRRCVIEAMFSYAVVKVGLEPTAQEVLGIDPGALFVDLVSIDDYILDMSAKDRRRIQWEGNDYWIDIDAARELYDGPSTKIEPDEYRVQGKDGQQRAESMSTGEGGDGATFKDQVRLRDIWLPGERKMLTYGVYSDELFRSVEWEGPDHGPYHTLGFSDVPDNVLPLPPVALWRDLHELGNRLFRKLGNQADGKKTVHAFQGDEDAVNAFRNARDGDGIRYSGQKPEELTTAGVDAPTLAFYLQTKDLASYFAGNLDALGGLGAMSDTVGQDKMMSESANARVNSMSDQTVDFAKSIFKSIAWYEWTNPLSERRIEKEVKGTSIKIERVWSKKTRKGDFLDYNFDIDVYSMQDDSPSTKMQKLGAALERFVFPALPFIEQQGGQLDMREMIELIARYSNLPELARVIRFDVPIDEREIQGDSTPEKSRKPSHTTRTYERVNRPGATRHGKDDTLSRMLMGGNVQGAEADSLFRRAG